MLPKKDECSCQACAQNEFLKKLLFYEWDLDTQEIKKTLLKLLVIFIESDRIENTDQFQREMIGDHISQIINTIELLEDFCKIKAGAAA